MKNKFEVGDKVVRISNHSGTRNRRGDYDCVHRHYPIGHVGTVVNSDSDAIRVSLPEVTELCSPLFSEPENWDLFTFPVGTMVQYLGSPSDKHLPVAERDYSCIQERVVMGRAYEVKSSNAGILGIACLSNLSTTLSSKAKYWEEVPTPSPLGQLTNYHVCKDDENNDVTASTWRDGTISFHVWDSKASPWFQLTVEQMEHLLTSAKNIRK